MNLLRTAMQRTDNSQSAYRSLDRLEQIINQLDQSRTINPAVRADILSLIDDVLELSYAMLNNTYPVNLVLRKTTSILATAQRVLLHTESHAPSKQAFGAMLPDGTLLPVTADTQDEANMQLAALMRIGVATTAMVVPIKISSQYILQPQAGPEPPAPQQFEGARIPERLSATEVRTMQQLGDPRFQHDPRTAPFEGRAEAPLTTTRPDTGEPIRTAGIAGAQGTPSGPAPRPAEQSVASQMASTPPAVPPVVSKPIVTPASELPPKE